MPTLITSADIESLPLEPTQRFVALEEICRKRYEDLVADQDYAAAIEDARQTYMITIVGAAKELKIEPIASLEIPSISKTNDGEYDQFKRTLEFYLIQLALQGAERNNRLSILLEGNTKARLHTLVSHIREHIRNLELTPAKKDRLTDRLNAFEKELEARRLNFAVVAGFTLGVASAISDVGGAADQIKKLVHEVEVVIGNAKEQQDIEAVGRIGHSPVPRLEAPPESIRPPITRIAGTALAQPKQSFDLDDEIPF